MIIHPVYKKFLLPTLAWLLACGTILSAEEMQPGNKDLIDAAVASNN